MMMQKLGKVTILGGTGFIGSQLAIKLSKLSSNIDVLTRNAESNQSLKMIPNLEIRQIDVTDERNLNLCFKDSDLVINTIGILNEFDEDNTFDNIHYELTKKLTKALNANNIKRYLHISSLNANPDAPSKYLKSKGLAENHIEDNLREFCNYTIFRPSIVFGEKDSFFNKFSTLLKILPIFPLACPESKFMPIYVNDLTEFMIDCILNRETFNKKIDATGPREYTFRQLIDLTLKSLQIKRLIIPLNYTLSKLQAQVFQRLPGKLFTVDNFKSLQIDSVSSTGFKGSSLVENIVPRYLNASYSQRHFEKLRKKSGRK